MDPVLQCVGARFVARATTSHLAASCRRRQARVFSQAQEAVLEACRTADLELPKVADRHSNEIALGQLSLAQLTEQHRHERQVGDLQPGSASVSASAWVSTLVLARFVEPRKVVDYSDYGPTRMAISTYRGS